MSWLRGLCALLLLVLLAAPLEAQVVTERFALVIGNNRPEREDAATLRYADDDAVATHRLLSEAGVHSALLVRLDADSQRLFGAVESSGPPRAAQLERAFAAIVAEMRSRAAQGARTELFLFFSGHGDVDAGEGYVVLEDRRLTRSALFELLARAPSDQNHVFIDACKSYFVVFDRGPGGRRAPHAGPDLSRVPARLDNTGFVLSTSSERDSHEWERYQGGILSHELRSALRGAADVDLDARVSYGELAAFLNKANQAIVNPRFRPDYLVRAPRGDLQRAVWSWGARAAALQLGAAYLGPVYVESVRGERLLDAHPAPGQPLGLWLPAERPLFVRRKDGLGEAVIESRETASVRALARVTPQIASRGALQLAFESLFSEPFAERDVARFTRAATALRDERRANESDELRRAVGITALVSAAAGLASSGMALGTYLSADGDSQVDVEAANRRVRTYNLVSMGCYAVAAVTGVLWAWAPWESDVQLTWTPATRGSVGEGVGVSWSTRF